MSETLGNYNRPSSAIITIYANYNQRGQLVTVPSSGRITRLGCWLRGGQDEGQAPIAVDWPFRFVVWSAAGTVLAQSALQAAPGTDKYAEQVTFSDMLRLEADLTSPLTVAADQQILVGVAGATGGADITYFLPVGPSGSHKYKSVSSWPGSMSGASTYGHYIGAYAFLEPAVVRVRRGGEWVEAEAVYVRRSGAWVPAESVQVRRSGEWTDPE